MTKNAIVGPTSGPVGDTVAGNGDTDFIDRPNHNYFPSANSVLNAAGSPAHTTEYDFNWEMRNQGN